MHIMCVNDCVCLYIHERERERENVYCVSERE